MLLEFAIQNFKSYKDLQVFSMEASKEKENDENVVRVVKTKGDYRVVKTKAIYGANASGKSNLIRGLVSMWQIIKYNLIDKEVFQKFISPYRQDENLRNQPSYFQIIFTEDGNKYRYGFEVDQEKVHREWLYQKKEKEVVLFEREGQKITELNESSFHEGKIIKKGIKMFTEKTLIVSILDQLSSEVSTKIVSNITNKIIITPTFIDRTGYLFNRVINQFEKDKDFKNWTLKLLKEIDSSISDIKIEEKILLNGQMHKSPVVVRYTNNYDEHLLFSMAWEEASGTQKIFEYSKVIYLSIKGGKTFIIDEMDALLHPKLTRKIIDLFQSPEAHPEAQLIFATHDTNLMDSELLRRDQITFVEKSNEGFSEIYDLSDINDVRANDLFEKNYLKGNYGALPILNNFENTLLNG